ncbi:Retrotransposon protein Ty1-copia subclass [Zea mays]|uniref:Retrotransposon protein Ty1-copia subclass n=1 Tax=Zea mays TaxID=4577 RepID=A0A1D6HIZ9_MAIZE|nr:Retrotransposon protein Ty1-copia subclass [Zea mays]
MASPTAGDAPLASPSPSPAADATDAALAAAAAVPDPDISFGFLRPELGKEKLVGTVGFHERHVFLCYKGPEVWPSHVEAAHSDRLPRLLAAAIKARKPNLKKTIKFTICEGEDGTESSNGDVLIFPDMIRYKGLTHFDVDNFVEEVFVKDIDWLPGSPEPISGSYVFVCSHQRRDIRWLSVHAHTWEVISMQEMSSFSVLMPREKWLVIGMVMLSPTMCLFCCINILDKEKLWTVYGGGRWVYLRSSRSKLSSFGA